MDRNVILYVILNIIYLIKKKIFAQYFFAVVNKNIFFEVVNKNAPPKPKAKTNNYALPLKMTDMAFYI